ncbi:MAG TPA: hypothetical protein VNB94_05755 [Mycobacteriales bacterium]|nr:hypothetical protein [Mycobacteriales bacterium]
MHQQREQLPQLDPVAPAVGEREKVRKTFVCGQPLPTPVNGIAAGQGPCARHTALANTVLSIFRFNV